MYTKKQRHTKILELIKNEPIERQEDIAQKLNSLGYMVTQATVSRDIRDLKLIKQSIGGIMRYVLPEESSSAHTVKLIDIFSNSVVSVENAENLLVVKTLSGTAHAAASAIDAMSNSMILGTIAGDDTILIITKNSEQAISVKNEISQLIK
ncbi:MAG: arginine repressor [Clostridia bacterium]|nr:arginine repressor [Clostridia bacterium]